jgi:valyl-tRNA synthetase
MPEIPKAYVPQAVEEKWSQFWLERKCFTADPHSGKPAFSMAIPPPNVTGVLTLGHVLNNTIQDILARRARMTGHEVLWLPGTDHAGIATQSVVERALKKSGAIKHRNDLGREKFLEKTWEWKEKHGGIIIQQLKKLGASCDWTRERFTMDPEYSRCVQKVFVELYKKGLIYRGKRMVNWCPSSLTALSDEEVVMKEQKGFLYYFKVEVAEEPGTFLTIATTRPETIPGDTAVAANPKDPRYARLIGKHAVRPLPAELQREQKLIPIIGDEHVDFEFGTGVLKVTPAHDKADFEIGLRHKLAQIEVIGANGQMNDAAGADLRGLDRFKARKAAVEKLTEMGALVKEEPYTNNIGFSERADVPIEPRLSEQWFLKYPSVAQARHCVQQENEPDVRLERHVAIVRATGDEFAATTIHELRDAALAYARSHGFLGKTFRNEDSGIEIRVRRKSLSHAFSNRGEAHIKAVAVLPELIRTAIWISSEKHEGGSPRFKRVHRFIALLSLGGELHRVIIIGKELEDGTVLYDHKAKKITPGGKSLVAHLPKETLGIQPAPGAVIKLGDLLADVKLDKMHFYPQRWAKVYDHWMEGIQDWCISRQLWWGHRIPVWSFSKVYLPASLRTANDIDSYLRKLEKSGRSDVVVRYQGFVTFSSGNKSIDARVCLEATAEDIARELEGLGFTQDPDVLDTWFSSWLWPFATMGWPEQTDTLKKFYPTTDLVTGPDIIFFWVARMIMAGYEFTGMMPFKSVYFTGIIRDKQGRKMSKSLGNSPDPLDLIAQYGADALRFGVIRSAPLGQDVLYDEQQVELGRNFCNKLWNACRFRQMHPGPTEGEIRPELLTSDDKWILLKLDQAIGELSGALAQYKFNEAAQTLYRFFWSEFCDWYLEASKAALAGGDEAADASTAALQANALAVMDFVLSNTLRLFHPFLPFITEELWHGLGYHQDLPAEQGGDTIMFARWPQALGADFREHYGLEERFLKEVDARNELVTQGRHLRRAGNIPGNKKVKYIFKPAGIIEPRDLAAMKLLLNAEPLEARADYTPAKGTPAARSELGELYLPLEGATDAAAERERLHKEIAKARAEIEKVNQKLANPAFVQKVPPAVLEEHRKRLADWQSTLEHLRQSLESLGN